MPAHIKSSMFGCALTYVPSLSSFFFPFLFYFVQRVISWILGLHFFRIPITDGHLNMGTWQVRKKISSTMDYLVLFGHSVFSR
jgi:hypothetical protein